MTRRARRLAALLFLGAFVWAAVAVLVGNGEHFMRAGGVALVALALGLAVDIYDWQTNSRSEGR